MGDWKHYGRICSFGIWSKQTEDFFKEIKIFSVCVPYLFKFAKHNNFTT